MAVLGFDPMSLVKMGLAFSLVALAAYIYFAVALMTIAKKKNTPNGWLAFIPIANIYLMTQIAGLSAWYTLVILLPIIPLIGYIAMVIIMIYFWWKIAEAIKKPGWWSLLLLIPIVNFVIVGIMAWEK